MFTQSKFPTELIFQFLCHSDPRDVIRWRAVSKKFDAIIRDAALWKTLYKSAPFPLPSGPFATQSSESLERTLVKAARLAESWTTRPMRVLSSILVDTVDPRHSRFPTDRLVKFVFGRWVIVHQNQQFVLHDVDIGTKRCTSQILWELGGTRVTGWDARPMVSPEGQCMVYMLVQFIPLPRSPNWKLLKFWLDQNSGALCNSVVVDPPDDRNNEYTPCLQAGNSRFIFIPTNQDQLVFDTRTDMFYAIPLWIQVRKCSLLDWTVFSDTYLLFLSHNRHQTNVHIFTLPPDAPVHQGLPILHHTHNDIIYNPFQEVKFMKPTVNLTTGETNIRFFDYHAQRAGLELEYVEVTVPKRSIGTVLPLEDKVDHINLPKERVWLSRYDKHYQHIDISDNGHVRGFFRGVKRSRRPKLWEFDGIRNQDIMKFAIDTTQNPWAIACSRIAPSEWDEEEDSSRGNDTGGRSVGFDGLRGTLCHVHHSSGRICVEDIE